MASLPTQGTSSVTVTGLQQLHFSQLSLDEKVAIKARGRPMPDIQIAQQGVSNNKKYIRRFNMNGTREKVGFVAAK